ncbi:uncharacterized protein FYW47_016623 [Aplochiton taeniatus]
MVEIQPAALVAYPLEGNPLESEEESDGLMDWWKTVEGWDEWNETSNFKEEDEEMAVEQVADRVFMGARLFVRLFNQRGASLQQRILKLLAQADAADQFHKKTVSAAVGGGVASVVGSVATITGLILAPFTFGASVIVTAVGISVATAGSIASASANITDTVHSNMDRKKVEKMIQGYQEEMNDIRECLDFVQEGMDALQEWDFEKYSESASKKALNHNIKHVFKEGGRAGKALMINTDKLISTVQVLSAAGGAAKAAQVVSVTTGVMSALFLALDVFFLAKDSHELRKGAKTKFAAKLREVCKELQNGLLELNKVKTQLQKTMDGIELEEYEEEVEEEVEVDLLEADPVKLAQLEQELDLLEEKLDKKIQDELKVNDKSMKEVEKRNTDSCKEKGNEGKRETLDVDNGQEEGDISRKSEGIYEKEGMKQKERKGDNKDTAKGIKDEEKEDLIKNRKDHNKLKGEKESKNETEKLGRKSEDKKDEKSESMRVKNKASEECKGKRLERGNAMANENENSKANERKQSACKGVKGNGKVIGRNEKVEEKSKDINESSKAEKEKDRSKARGSGMVKSVGKRSGKQMNHGREVERGSSSTHEIRTGSEKPPVQKEREQRSKHEVKDAGRKNSKDLQTDDKRKPFSTEKSETRTGETERGLRDWKAETGRSQKGKHSEKYTRRLSII